MTMRYDAHKKSAGAAYLIWFFLGSLGVHRFYLGHTGSGAAMLIVFIASILLSVVAIGFIGFLVLGIWWIVDAFLISGMVRDFNNNLANELSR
jgi:TM2 domain-containing membrane protein YozV